ncbi:hypothetical protein ACHAQA_007185 [Verticillium albo-atrum]
MQGVLTAVALLALTAQSAASKAPAGRSRDHGTFADPASRERPRFRYWLPDGGVDPEVVKSDIKSVGALGAGGVEFVPFYNYGGQLGGAPPGVDWSKYGFGTPDYLEVMQAALDGHYENELAMDFGFGPSEGQGVPASSDDEGLQWDLIAATAGVPANGKFDQKIPGWGSGELVAVVSALVLSSKNITITTVGIQGPRNITYEDMVLKSSSLDDISDLVSADGKLDAAFPRPCNDARFRVFVFYQKLSGHLNLKFQSNTSDTIWDNGSYAVDHFDARGAKVTTDFWDKYILNDEITEKLKAAGNYGWEDSMELQSNVSWSPTLPARFRKKFGYDLKPYLPLLLWRNNNINIQKDAPGTIKASLDSEDGGEGYVNDFRAALAEGYQEYLQTLSAWLKRTLNRPLSVQPSYNLPMDMLASIPFVDVPESESLQAQNNVDGYRYFTGAANVAGKNIVSNELGAVFGRGFSFAIPELLQMANRGFSGGLNQFVIHGQSYSGAYPETTWPGHAPFRYAVSDLFNSKRPDWENGLGHALDYMGRLQHVQRLGLARVDVAIYLKQSVTDPEVNTIYQSDDLRKGGWSYNYLSPENFALPNANVRSGSLASEGPAYKALVILASQNLTAESVDYLSQYASQGLPIILAGGTPGYYPNGDASSSNKVEAGIASLLESDSVHQVEDDRVAEKLISLGLQPQAGIEANGIWYTTWREDAETGIDYLYVFCDSDNSVSGELSVQSTKTPYIFDAWTGTQSPLLHYRVEGEKTVIPLDLAGNQTAVFAFASERLEGVELPETHFTELPASVVGYTVNSTGTYLHVAAGAATSAKLPSGDEVALSSTATAAFELQSWELTAEHWEAPEDFNDASIVAVKRNTSHALTELVLWSEIPELVNASGVGHYVSNFTWPGRAGGALGAYIQFPAVLNAIILYVNGDAVGPLDYMNPVADISAYLVEGMNEIEAVVPSTMWNYIRSLQLGGKTLLTGGLTGIAPPGSSPPTENGLVGKEDKSLARGLRRLAQLWLPLLYNIAPDQRDLAPRKSEQDVLHLLINRVGKKRRVKCDEAKPYCQRCLRWQGFCEGYDAIARAAFAASSEHSEMGAGSNPGSQAKRLRRLAQAPTREDNRILAEPLEQLFRDDHEKRFFVTWCDTRKLLGGGFFEDELWERTILQLSHQQPAVRYAIMGLGAMGKSLRQGFVPTTHEEMAAYGPEYGHALSYYGRALRDVRKTVLDAGSLRATIVCCLLFVCFEVLHSDCRAAYAHLDSGQVLMNEMVRRARASGIASNILESESLERDSLQVFQRLIHQTWSYGVIRPPVMEHLEAQSTDKIPSTWCCRGGPRNSCVIEKMPTAFDNFADARRWWEVTQHYITHSSNIVFRITHKGLSSVFGTDSEEYKLGRMATDQDVAAHAYPQAQQYEDSLRRWWLVFQPMWEAAEATKYRDWERYLQGAHLRVQYLNMYACVMAPLGCDFSSVVAMTPLYREIVRLSSEILPRQREKFGENGDIFSMDSAVTFPLFQTSMRCRNVAVREGAIRLLQENPRRDGMWDSRMFEALVVQNRVLEAENAREGTNDEQWWRLQSRRAHLDEAGTLKTIAMIKDPSSGDKWMLQERPVGRFLYV